MNQLTPFGHEGLFLSTEHHWPRHEKSLFSNSFDVQASCAEGYTGHPKVEICNEPDKPYGLSGCRPKVCVPPKEIEAYSSLAGKREFDREVNSPWQDLQAQGNKTKPFERIKHFQEPWKTSYKKSIYIYIYTQPVVQPAGIHLQFSLGLQSPRLQFN